MMFYGSSWVPRDDSTYPDELATCLICGATVDYRSGNNSQAIHAAFHVRHGHVKLDDEELIHRLRDEWPHMDEAALAIEVRRIEREINPGPAS